MYNIYSILDDRSTWFHECFASWAGLDYANIAKKWEGSYEDWSVDYLNLFNAENSSNYSLDSTFDDKHYGSFVLAFYITQNCGGISTIRKILEQRQISGPYPYYYINDALFINQGTTFEDVFTDFSTENAVPFYFTDFPHSERWINSDIEQVYLESLNYYSSNPLAPMSADYIKIYTDEITDLEITIESNNDDFTFSTIRNLPNNIKHVSKWDMSTGRVTIVIPNFAEYPSDDITLVGISPDWRTNSSMNYTVYVRKHQHSYEYYQYDDYYHKKVCSCGSTILEKHTWSFQPDGRAICIKCGYISPIIIW